MFQVRVVMMTVFACFFPGGGVDTENPVHDTEAAGGADDRDEAEQAPPTETVHAEEKNRATEEESHPRIIRTYVVFHRRDRVVQRVRLPPGFRCAWLVQSWAYLDSSVAPPDPRLGSRLAPRRAFA